MKKQAIIFIVLVFITLVSCSNLLPISNNRQVTREMDEAISNYIIQYSQNRYLQTEKQFEVHKVYGTEEKNGVTTVYLYSLYEGFNLATKTEGQAGHSMPALIRLKKDGSTYSVIEYKEPKDGSNYEPSIKKMFPSVYAKQALRDSGHIEKLEMQMKEKVEQWLPERTK